jgi:hypothetical protein
MYLDWPISGDEVMHKGFGCIHFRFEDIFEENCHHKLAEIAPSRWNLLSWIWVSGPEGIPIILIAARREAKREQEQLQSDGSRVEPLGTED